MQQSKKLKNWYYSYVSKKDAIAKCDLLIAGGFSLPETSRKNLMENYNKNRFIGVINRKIVFGTAAFFKSIGAYRISEDTVLNMFSAPKSEVAAEAVQEPPQTGVQEQVEDTPFDSEYEVTVGTQCLWFDEVVDSWVEIEVLEVTSKRVKVLFKRSNTTSYIPLYGARFKECANEVTVEWLDNINSKLSMFGLRNLTIDTLHVLYNNGLIDKPSK